jgi:hypothetical protein
LNSNSNLNFWAVATAGYRYRTPAVAAVTAVYRAVTDGKKNPTEQATPTRPVLRGGGVQTVHRYRAPNFQGLNFFFYAAVQVKKFLCSSLGPPR